jgi:hypothetical protein
MTIHIPPRSPRGLRAARPLRSVVALGGLGLALLGSPAACSSGRGSTFEYIGGGSSGGGSSGNGSGGSGGGSGSFGGSSNGGGSNSSSGGGTACPSGLMCNVSCSGNTTTTISGKVYDPAGRNPLYNIVAYVPANPLQALPKGVPMGSDACNCGALFKSGAIVSTTTGVDGTFQLTNAPVGSNVPLVIQVGKWRRVFHINVTACQDNPQADHTLLLPNSVAPNDMDDNMPDIAVSTGSADTLECLMTRIGLPTPEYVAGPGGSGHVHVFSGGGQGGGGGGGVGRREQPGMAGAPTSSTDLWSSQSQLMPYDLVLLSCEGGETYNANPQALEAYLNAGGRVFGSHFHYSWFSGPLGSGQNYSAPSDWGTNLASWTANGGGGGGGGNAIGGTIVTTLNGTNQPFVKGQALDQWLGIVGALGQNGVPAGQLSIFQPRDNAQVGPGNKPSQPWITSDPWTMYFSFDTPVNAPPAPDGGAPQYCGRAVFSGLHVAGDPSTSDSSNPPSGCANGALSPQEKALEFMLFDLSSCVIPDTVPPSDAGIPPPQ